MIDFLFGMTPGDIIYDIETYPNVFTLYAVHAVTGQKWIFEFSERKNDTKLVCLFMNTLARLNCRMVGFNNINFDYPVIHHIYTNSKFITVKNIYDKAMSIINSYDDKFSHIIWDNNRIVPQVDLFKIHHFDNISRATSLKVLEFNMRSTSIQDLPFKVGTFLDLTQIETLIEYNEHDVLETLKFYNLTKEKIKFREELTVKYGKNFVNHNDTKIGKDYFIMRLEERKPGSCYRMVNGKRKTVQTERPFINFKDIIFPYIQFEHPKFNRVLKFFKSKTVTETKGVFTTNIPEDLTVIVKGEKRLGVEINGIKFIFGTGGIHGSVDNSIVHSDDNYIIEDWDVASYYPNLAIVNELYPAHLGKEFCDIYKEVYEQRKQYPKGTAENSMLKLALNGVYGDSNNEYSPFYDPQYTMSITINGQLLLCMLAEWLFKYEGHLNPKLNHTVKLIQINTDGLTLRYHRNLQHFVHSTMTTWEILTGLKLENNTYKRMFIRDVNNYIAEYPDGKVKRKGAYEYETIEESPSGMDWNKNYSALIVAKAAEEALLHGMYIEPYIQHYTNVMDFMLRTKLPRKYILEWGGEQVQNVSRYYVSTEGDTLEKVMPAAGPEGTFKRKNRLLDSYYQEILKEVGNEWDERIHTKNKSIYEERRSGIHPTYTVQICNRINDCTYTDINYDFYIQETRKLVECLS